MTDQFTYLNRGVFRIKIWHFLSTQRLYINTYPDNFLSLYFCLLDGAFIQWYFICMEWRRLMQNCLSYNFSSSSFSVALRFYFCSLVGGRIQNIYSVVFWLHGMQDIESLYRSIVDMCGWNNRGVEKCSNWKLQWESVYI